MTDVDEAPVVVRRPPGHLSPSSAKLLAECPRRFEFAKVFGLREPPGRAAVLGTVIHKAWELLSGVAKGLRSERVAARILDELWWALTDPPDAQGPRYLVPSDPDVVEMVRDFASLRLSDDDAEQFRREAWQAVAYIVEQEPVVAGDEVAHRELPLETEVGGVPFKGRADRVDRHPDGLAVLDLKSGKSPLDAAGRVIRSKLADLSDQLLLYKPAVEQVTRKRVVACSLYFVGVSGRSWVPVDLSGVGRAVDRFAASWERLHRYEAQRRYPAKPSKLCAWCPYFDACPEGSAMVLALRDWMRVWEADNGVPTPARARVNSWPALRRQEWVAWGRASWEALQEALRGSW